MLASMFPISNKLPSSEVKINLKGILVENACTDPVNATSLRLTARTVCWSTITNTLLYQQD